MSWRSLRISARRIAAAEAARNRRERIVIDPGFGFGKDAGAYLDLLRHLGQLRELGCRYCGRRANDARRDYRARM